MHIVIHSLQVVLRVSLLMMWTMAVVNAEEPFEVHPIPTQKANLPPKVVSLLNSSGIRVTTFSNGLETTVAEVFWANSISVLDKVKPSPGLLYPGLTSGEWIGVIRYAPGENQEYREDFRDQKLRPGYYTMRYARIPADKKHRHVAAYDDFILLSPIQADGSPALTLNSEELIRLSRIATRNKHPAVLSLVPADSTESENGSLRPDDSGRWILQINMHARSSGGSMHEPLSLAWILVTPVKENGGS